MPIYEYQCESCGFRLEKLRRINDEPLLDCPECSEPRLRRLVSAAAFRLKGAGWYETDFKQDGKRNLFDPGSSPSEKATDKAAEKASDKAPEKATDKAPEKALDKPTEAKKTETKKAEPKPTAKPATD